MTWSTSVGRHARRLQRVGERGLAPAGRRRPRRSAPPRPVRVGLPRRPPAVEELGGGAGAGHPLGDHAVAVGARRRTPRRRRRRRARRRPRQPGAQVGQHGQRAVVAGHRCGRPAAPPTAERHRADQVVGAGPAGQPERGVDRGGVGLVQVGRRRRGEEQVLGDGRRRVRRAPGGPPPPPSSWCPRRRRPPSAPPPGGPPEAGADGLALEAPVREVRTPGHDAVRSWPPTPARQVRK